MDSYIFIIYLLIAIVDSLFADTITSALNNYEYNEDIHFNFSRLVTKYGYPVEKHEVISSDGYVLNSFRIPKKGPIVVICHGQLSSSDDFVTIGPQAGLPYQLANADFDVWSINFRGNKYSLGHVTLSTTSAEYWDYTFDEMGRYDLPAYVDYILKVANAKDLMLIGHSQGTNAILVFLSERPEYNDKISMAYLLGTTAYMGHTNSLGLILAAGPLTPDYYKLANSVGLHSIMSDHDIGPLVTQLENVFCSTPETANIYCKIILFLSYGENQSQINKTSLPVIFGHFPTSTSIKSSQHYVQLVKSGKFQQYDYGSAKNLEKYQSVDPPEYPIDKITTKIAIAWGENDWLCAEEDLNIFLNKVPVINLYKVPHKKFTHSDYIFAKDVKTLLYDKVIEILKAN